jgi:uncharacterized protein
VSHPTKSPYAIDVFDLLHRPGEMRERSLEIIVPEAFGNAVVGVRAGSILDVELRMESLHDGILVTADVAGVTSGECVRCLIDIEQGVEVEIQELFAYSQDEAFEYEVQTDTIDLEPVIRDAVVLSLPFQPVCQEDCLGLCPQCGVRLLDNPGHEHEAPVDPRWAALAGLDGLSNDEPNDVADTSTGATEEKR